MRLRNPRGLFYAIRQGKNERRDNKDSDMSAQMTGAKMVVQALIDQGVDTVFGYPGGAVLPIYDEIFQQNSIKHILVRHEQGAVHAAEGYARSTGKPGVALVTSGPAPTNAVPGLTDAPLASVCIHNCTRRRTCPAR